MPVKIPLTSDGSQTLTIEGMDLLVQWNDINQAWYMGISQNDIPLITGLRLTVFGYLLAPYALTVGDFLVLALTPIPVDPTLTGWVDGTFALIYYTQDEMNELLKNS